MVVLQFVGVNLYASSTPEMKDFYHDVLGVPLASEGFGGYDGANVGVEGTSSHLIFWNAQRWGQQAGDTMLVFKVQSLNAAYEELKGKGLQLDPPVTASWGGRELYLKDPAGNVVLLLE